jgi:hypothetical protein
MTSSETTVKTEAGELPQEYITMAATKADRKRGPKTYNVHIQQPGGVSIISATKSSPHAATSHAVRKVVKDLPLRTPVKVWTKSKSKYHKYSITRDYDNAKHRRFTIAREGPSIGKKQITPEHGVPEGF